MSNTTPRMERPRHLDHASCRTCGGRIVYLNAPERRYWTHIESPDRGHDAEPTSQ